MRNMAEPVANDARNLVQIAVDVHTDLNKLTVGLQHAGAQPQALQSLQQMSEIVGELVKVLGSGPVGGGGQPGSEQLPPQGPPQEAAPAGPSGPPQGPTPGARPNGFHEATAQLQSALASKHAAAQRALAAGQ